MSHLQIERVVKHMKSEAEQNDQQHVEVMSHVVAPFVGEKSLYCFLVGHTEGAQLGSNSLLWFMMKWAGFVHVAQDGLQLTSCLWH